MYLNYLLPLSYYLVKNMAVRENSLSILAELYASDSDEESMYSDCTNRQTRRLATTHKHWKQAENYKRRSK